MTRVKKFSEFAKLAEILGRTIEEIKRDINKGRPKSIDEIESIFWNRLSDLQDETEDVIRASLQEEAADGIIPPKNGGSFQNGGEHGAEKMRRFVGKDGEIKVIGCPLVYKYTPDIYEMKSKCNNRENGICMVINKKCVYTQNS